MIDASRLKLIQGLPTLPVWRHRHAHSIRQHRIDAQPCQCEALHGHCFAVRCPCPQHEGEMH